MKFYMQKSIKLQKLCAYILKIRDCHYITSSIGYWSKSSTVGWCKVLEFLYLLPFVLIIVDSRVW